MPDFLGQLGLDDVGVLLIFLVLLLDRYGRQSRSGMKDLITVLEKERDDYRERVKEAQVQISSQAQRIAKMEGQLETVEKFVQNMFSMRCSDFQDNGAGGCRNCLKGKMFGSLQPEGVD
jgi:hypothetical protein